MQSLKKLLLLFIACCGFHNLSAATAPTTYITEEKPAAIIQPQHPEFSIRLKSNPTTGYSWFLLGYDANLIQPVTHSFVAPTNKKLIGAPGFEVWTFRVKPNGFTVPMQTAIRFVYARPWEADDNQTKQVVFQITTRQAAHVK